MHDVLRQIIEKTKADLEERKKQISLEEILKQVQNDNGQASLFESAISAPKKGDIALIAEIKLASPSEGQLGNEEDLVHRAQAYEQAGADAISFVTEPHFFKGDVSHIGKVKEGVSLPILQKDFVSDEYQIYESKKAGADALLLIARLVDRKTLQNFSSLCDELGIEPLIEVYSEEDLEKALSCNVAIIAVNARDLDTMEVNIDRACELLQKIPKKFMKLGFSGIRSKENVEKYRHAGVNGVLVGTSLMKAENVKEFLEGLR